ncbi:L-rhamnose 1-dehydrogenase [Eremomyces bilateralis CBS 781.70]|uniref:L-rhamnose 1-dehydrogenase n=1 Tax=Eremomyces bilateralis CBS 781.70 TaxID=1392243 RepID=A0A6G1FRC5_9PEZI|nr:L-rhamnose 1-dehydrogenase [Eremomyces bilateralis CBS 781.70]KAF1808344.1 L-rhamnose 1-dehydrogenase [Eremomyces bilateralis CBS 781.70]
MPNLLKDKVAVITGGTSGIGRAIALEYLKEGASVVINHLGDDLSTRNLEGMKSEASFGSTLLGIAGDISQQETAVELIRFALEQLGRIDIFVSNAGVCQFAEFLSLEKDLFDSTISINLSGAFYATQAAARQMVAQGTGGSIIAISSISALVGGEYQSHYTPTKAGVLSLMQSCACALGKYNIRCNALLPGTIRTQLNEEDLKDQEKRKYMEGRIPLGRTGVPEDLAGPAVFLASDMSRYVNGAQLLVDGGLFVNLQ